MSRRVETSAGSPAPAHPSTTRRARSLDTAATCRFGGNSRMAGGESSSTSVRALHARSVRARLYTDRVWRAIRRQGRQGGRWQEPRRSGSRVQCTDRRRRICASVRQPRDDVLTAAQTWIHSQRRRRRDRGWLTEHAAAATAKDGAAEASLAGDFGYSYGTFEIKARAASAGAYVRLWSRDAAGRWWLMVDVAQPFRP